MIDGHELIGVVSIADLACSIGDEKVGDLVEAISATSGRLPRGEPAADPGWVAPVRVSS